MIFMVSPEVTRQVGAGYEAHGQWLNMLPHLPQ